LHLEKTAVPTNHLGETEGATGCIPLTPRKQSQQAATITPKEARWLKKSDPGLL